VGCDIVVMGGSACADKKARLRRRAMQRFEIEPALADCVVLLEDGSIAFGDNPIVSLAQLDRLRDAAAWFVARSGGRCAGCGGGKCSA